MFNANTNIDLNNNMLVLVIICIERLVFIVEFVLVMQIKTITIFQY